MTDEILVKLNETKRIYGDWTAHNIKLPNGHYTLGSEYSESDVSRGNFFVEVATCALGRDLNGLRVLDLGCLEGAISIQFARAGAFVDGIDIRPASIAKAEVVKDILGLKNIRFFVSDALQLLSNEFLESSYDVIICAGLLYHIDAPDLLPFLKAINQLCTSVTILDTHVALEPKDEYITEEGLILHGRFIKEYFSKSENENAMWAALDNEKSFWLSKNSLVNILYTAGYGMVSRIHQPFFIWPWKDRGTWIAFGRISLESQFESDMIPKLDQRQNVHPTTIAGYNYPITPGAYD